MVSAYDADLRGSLASVLGRLNALEAAIRGDRLLAALWSTVGVAGALPNYTFIEEVDTDKLALTEGRGLTTTRPNATDAAFGAAYTGVDFPTWIVQGDGLHRWGPGDNTFDVSLGRPEAGILELTEGRHAFSGTPTTQTLTNGATIDLSDGCTIRNVTMAGAVTGLVMPEAPSGRRELIIIANESAFTGTFAAVGTSRVLAGTGAVIPASKLLLLIWNEGLGAFQTT